MPSRFCNDCIENKEDQLADIEECYPADHYVVIDDNLRILKSITKTWQNKVTTIWLAPSRNGRESNSIRVRPQSGLTIHSIGDLRKKDLRAIKLLHNKTLKSEE